MKWYTRCLCFLIPVMIFVGTTIVVVLFFNKRRPLFGTVFEQKLLLKRLCSNLNESCYQVIDHMQRRRFRNETSADRYLIEEGTGRLISNVILNVPKEFSLNSSNFPIEPRDARSDLYGLVLMAPFLFGSFLLPPLRVRNEFLDLGGSSLTMLARSRFPFLEITLVNRDEARTQLLDRWFYQPYDNRTLIKEAKGIDFIQEAIKEKKRWSYIYTDAYEIDLNKEMSSNEKGIYSNLGKIVRPGGSISINMQTLCLEKGFETVRKLTSELQQHFSGCYMMDGQQFSDLITVCVKRKIPSIDVLMSRLETSIRDIRLNHMKKLRILNADGSLFLFWKK